MTRDPLYERWGDLLHETPEAEKPLREYLQRESDREWLEHNGARTRALKAELSGETPDGVGE